MYTLTVVDTAYQTSCGLAKDSVRISIQPCYLPTVITTTDVSFIQKLEIPGLIEGTSLIIYDVQGKLLYKADNYKNDWPNQGDSMPNGMYVYVVEFPIDPKGPLGKREVRKLLIRN